MAKKESKYPEEQRIADLIKSHRDSMSDPATDAQKGKLTILKQQLGAMKFARLASKRTNAALKQINNVGALAGKAYSCTPAQSERVVTALADAVEGVQKAFESPTKAKGPVFAL